MPSRTQRVSAVLMAERQRRRDSHVRPPLPEPLPPGCVVVDNHTHLDHEPDEATVTGLLTAARHVGVTRHVTIGCTLDAARWTVGAVERHRDLVGGVAIHPNEAPRLAAAGDLETALVEIERLAGHPRIRVVGETGMDTFRTDHAQEQAAHAQQESFRAHIEIAKRVGLPLQIHDRDAHRQVLDLLADAGAPEVTVFHCFSGDVEMARFCAAQGWYLSFAGAVTFTSADGLRAALAAVPLSQVLVETDAPYLTPVPYRGRLNAGYLVPLTLRMIAQVHDRPLEEVARVLNATSEALYGPW